MVEISMFLVECPVLASRGEDPWVMYRHVGQSSGDRCNVNGTAHGQVGWAVKVAELGTTMTEGKKV